MSKLFEDSRNDLLSRSRGADNYVPSNQALGKNRYQRRLHSRVSKSVKEFNEINMNKLFKENILDVSIRVIGETDEYIVKISCSGFLQSLKGYMESARDENEVDVHSVTRALADCFNHKDVYVHCSCPDWQYRQSYWATVNDINSGDPENRPSDKTNPNDTKGAGCKHVLLVLNNTSWIVKVASVITNYIRYMKTHYQDLYARVIYPAIFEKEYEEPTQLDMFNQIDEVPEDELQTDKDAIDTANRWARTKNQFQVGNEYRFKPDSEVKGQKQFDFDSVMSDTL